MTLQEQAQIFLKTIKNNHFCQTPFCTMTQDGVFDITPDGELIELSDEERNERLEKWRKFLNHET